jgi:hypothetical protein
LSLVSPQIVCHFIRIFNVIIHTAVCCIATHAILLAPSVRFSESRSLSCRQIGFPLLFASEEDPLLCSHYKKQSLPLLLCRGKLSPQPQNNTKLREPEHIQNQNTESIGTLAEPERLLGQITCKTRKLTAPEHLQNRKTYRGRTLAKPEHVQRQRNLQNQETYKGRKTCRTRTRTEPEHLQNQKAYNARTLANPEDLQNQITCSNFKCV